MFEAIGITMLATVQVAVLIVVLVQKNRTGKLITRLGQCNSLVDRHTSQIVALDARDDRQAMVSGEALHVLRQELEAVRDHVGVISPEQLSRLAAVDHLRAEYRSIGLAVDADELDENQLRELEQALLTLKTAPIRRETDIEVDADLQAMFDDAHPEDHAPVGLAPDTTGPLPHAADATDEHPTPFNGGTLSEWPGNAS